MPPRGGGGGGGARGGGGGGRRGGGGFRGGGGARHGGGGGGRHRHRGHVRHNGIGFGFWGGPSWGGDYYDCVRDPYAPWRCLPPYAALWGDEAAAAAPTAPPPPAKPGFLSSRAVQLGIAAAAGYFIGKGRLF